MNNIKIKISNDNDNNNNDSSYNNYDSILKNELFVENKNKLK
jgi:hypothetical protein